MTEPVQPSLVVESDRIHNHCGVSLPMADRSSHPEQIRIFWNWAAVGINAAHRVIVLVKHERIFGRVYELKWIWVEIDARDARRIAFREHRIVCRLESELPSIGGFGLRELRHCPGSQLRRIFRKSVIGKTTLRPRRIAHHPNAR